MKNIYLIVILFLIIDSTQISSQSLTWLGTLSGGYISEATDVSLDGSIIAGTSDDGNGNTRAVVWDAYGSITDLGTLGGSQSYAYGISGNGGTIVGKSTSNLSPNRAFKYFSRNKKLLKDYI